jgi:hypothetical protein
MKTKTEYDKFENLVRGVLSVPHSEIKAKLDAERIANKQKNDLSNILLPLFGGPDSG